MPIKIDTIFGEYHEDMHCAFWRALPENVKYVIQNYDHKILECPMSYLKKIQANSNVESRYEAAKEYYRKYKEAKGKGSNRASMGINPTDGGCRRDVRRMLISPFGSEIGIDNESFEIENGRVLKVSGFKDCCLARSFHFMGEISKLKGNVFGMLGAMHVVDFVSLLDEFEINPKMDMYECLNSFKKRNNQIHFGSNSLSKEDLVLLKHNQELFFKSLEKFSQRYKEGEYHLQLFVEKYRAGKFGVAYDTALLAYNHIRERVLRLENKGYKISTDFVNFKDLRDFFYVKNIDRFPAEHFPSLKDVVNGNAILTKNMDIYRLLYEFLKLLKKYSEYKIFRTPVNRDQAYDMISLISDLKEKGSSFLRVDLCNREYLIFCQMVQKIILAKIQEQRELGGHIGSNIKLSEDYVRILKTMEKKLECIGSFLKENTNRFF